MKVSQGTIGRVFVLRLEDGDRLPDCIETFAAANDVGSALCAMLGGIGSGNVVAGPADGNVMPPVPMLRVIDAVHEAAAVGTIFPDESGTPRLHMHAALGRDMETLTGCIRPGVDVWTIGECVVLEILDADMLRKVDPKTGFELLEKAGQ